MTTIRGIWRDLEQQRSDGYGHGPGLVSRGGPPAPVSEWRVLQGAIPIVLHIHLNGLGAHRDLHRRRVEPRAPSVGSIRYDQAVAWREEVSCMADAGSILVTGAA